MKNLIFCSFLLLFVGFTYAQESVKVEEIDLEIMTKNLGDPNFRLGQFSQEEGKKLCTDLGDSWRLPTKDELKKIVKYKDLIGGFDGFDGYYWSSSEYDEAEGWGVYFTGFKGFEDDNGASSHFSKHYFHYVRAVRDLK